MDENLPSVSTPDQPFLQMAERIQRNFGDFQGAFLIVLPGGETIEGMLLGPTPDVGMLLGLVSTKIGMKAQELDDAKRQGHFR